MKAFLPCPTSCWFRGALVPPLPFYPLRRGKRAVSADICLFFFPSSAEDPSLGFLRRRLLSLENAKSKKPVFFRERGSPFLMLKALGSRHPLLHLSFSYRPLRSAGRGGTTFFFFPPSPSSPTSAICCVGLQHALFPFSRLAGNFFLETSMGISVTIAFTWQAILFFPSIA